MKVLTLLWLLGVASLTVAEVVQSFKATCSQFFILNLHTHEVVIPTVLKGAQYKHICQRWKEKYRYATLYDTKRRIPVYSAYKFEGKQIFKQDSEWKTEPQLDNRPGKEMMRMSLHDEEKLPFRHQARNNDYNRGCGYSRGHLFPKSYAADGEQAESTFTLTNAAPQMQESNEEWAKQVEIPMCKEIENICAPNKTHPAYIVTGVVPGEKWLTIERGSRTIEQGVNIPSHFWSAYSCINKKTTRRFSNAYLAQQIYEIKPDRKTKFKKNNMTVVDLEHKLSELYHQKFHVF